jgi:hypothetical protein
MGPSRERWSCESPVAARGEGKLAPSPPPHRGKVSHDNEYVDMGLELAHEFSAQCPSKYTSEDVAKRWESFTSGGDKTVGFSTLVKMNSRSYDNVKADFEQSAFKVMKPLQYCVQRPDGDLWQYSRAEFKDVFENVLFDGQKGRSPFIPSWMQDPTIRTFDEFVFDPPPCTAKANCYNLFTSLCRGMH